MAPVRQRELRPIWLITIVGAAIWAFLALLDEVRENGTSAFDRAILLAFRAPGQPGVPVGPPWLQETARDVTALGGFTVLTLLTILAALWLVLQRRRAQALVFVGAVVGTQVVASTLKALIGRPRPDLINKLDLVSSSSFPSGHSTMAPVVYLTLAAIVVAGEPERRIRLLLVTAAILLVAAVGVSRVYLGVHWPTDVLAGWTLGGTVALIATAILGRLARAAA